MFNRDGLETTTSLQSIDDFSFFDGSIREITEVGSSYKENVRNEDEKVGKCESVKVRRCEVQVCRREGV